jgi:ABC-type dipeptide/oligopeptide/nickel transport system ATPase component/ABC-type dipeptide/oligopeptide/nickel transport system permease subunit
VTVDINSSAQPTPDRTDRQTSLVRRTVRNPLGFVCSLILLVFVLVGLFAPLLAPFDPNLTRTELTNASAFTSDFALGGDNAGRDILSRLIWGTRGTLSASFIVLTVSVLLGVTGGLIAGFYGGAADVIGSWTSDAVMALPGVVLLIALYSIIGPSILISMAVFGVLIAPSYFRLVRGVVQGVRRELYVDAARVAGLSDARIVFRHILGAVRGPIVISSAFVLGAGIAIQASLEFLGLGSTREASWGGMLQLAFKDLYRNPQNVWWPAVTISLVILTLVLLGNVIRDTMQATSHQKPLNARTRRALAARLRETVPAAPAQGVLLDVRDLRVGYPSGGDVKDVVRGVSLSVRPGEIHGLVGESGSGKSQTAFAVLGLLPKEAVVTGGTITFDRQNMLASDKLIQSVRGRRIAYVPQEPMSNLDPTLTIGEQLTYGLRAVKKMTRQDAKEHLLALLTRVGIKDPGAVWRMYPHEISGGMAQRVLITGAIASDPDLIIADEPTTALDVTVQADVLELLRGLRDERGLGMILVTHNLGVVADICDTVSVMKNGEIVESAETVTLFSNPETAYTRELLSASIAAKVV